jgi:hypothetical protein
MSNKAEILQASYWEHFKFAKELAMYLPLNHYKRVKIEAEINKIQKQLNEIQISI